MTSASGGGPHGVSDDWAKGTLLALFQAAVDAAQPKNLFTPDILPPQPKGRTSVFGCGKAAGAMAAAFEAVWPHGAQGFVVTQYGYGVSTREIEVAEAAHPVPDAASLAAGQRLAELARLAGTDDLIIALIAGGGSALACLPAPGISLADKQEINRRLLASGARIGEMNRVRRALSAIKGGRLAALAAPAPTVTYMISDVPGDDPAAIAGGPMALCPEDGREALVVMARLGIEVDPRVRDAILANPAPAELPGPHEAHLIATPALSLAAAAGKAEAEAIEVRNLGDRIEGEARDVARTMAEEV
ncbi:MAG TPA: DUF4147 domain-containing protein, partial [Alphaproteobacteria bacterium]|nr:DUF4147 domain-containing protein [Alphaproteobacteria bacterium]